MKKSLLTLMSICAAFTMLQAQRYVTEIFSSVTLTPDVNYGSNYYFIPLQGSPIPVGAPGAIPPLGYTPTVGPLRANFYEPTGDTETSRPAVIIVHTGNFLPRYRNGSAVGDYNDSVNVELANRFARRGFLAVSPQYRLGWDPLNVSQEVRTSTILNAVYRAIHDVQTMVRFLKENYATYGVDTNRIILCGIGTGGYVTMAYTSLDKQTETELPKFLNSLGASVINPAYVGDVHGQGGAVNTYNHPGHSNKVAMEINLGGALGDISWVEAGDAMKIGFHCWKDQFAPYDSGTVIVPVTGEDVVDVHGTRTVVKRANQLGNNAAILSYTFNDVISDVAYARNPKAQYEGLFEFTPGPGINGNEQNSPWHWWDPATVDAMGTAMGVGPIHANEVQFNPNMSPTHARKYIDTIMWYSIPRIVVGLNLPEAVYVGQQSYDTQADLGLEIYPNPTMGEFSIKLNSDKAERVEILDLTGKLVYSQKLNGQSNVQIAPGTLKAGTYIVSVKQGDGLSQNKRLIIK